MEKTLGIKDFINRIRAISETRLASLLPDERAGYIRRLETYGPDVLELLCSLYGERDDCQRCLERIFESAAEAYAARPAALKALDERRLADPTWYQHHTMMGAVCYVDLYAGTIDGIAERIPYFKELGLTYLHLMPLFHTPPGPNDGGYAVTSYREVNPALGTIDDLRRLAAELRDNGISLALDFVFNHTADNHTWALKARAGDLFYRGFYFLFDDRTLPDAYEKSLREIFPERHQGAFSYLEDIDQWVWTTFHSYQWDLNYANPAVFQHMLEEMLFLANLGVEVLRLDAVAFIWKKMGTNCENLPQAHTIIQAFNVLVRIAAPAMVFKSEAIVHPDDVVKYFGSGKWAGRECEISYNPLLMVELWEALATRHTHLLTYSMKHRFAIPPNCAWINYVRSHDDIGWGFADEDAEALGIHGFYHRQYLNRFYTGEEQGSFACGHPFQFNPRTLDMRISGTTASLAGLEQALKEDNEHLIDLAVRRILLIYGIVISMGGIPLIYLGDEVGQINDYRYEADPAKADDNRWMHRPYADSEKIARRYMEGTIEASIFQAFKRMIDVRKKQAAFGAATQTVILNMDNKHVYGFVKIVGGERVLVLGNFTEDKQIISADQLPLDAARNDYQDLLKNCKIETSHGVNLESYDLLWIPL